MHIAGLLAVLLLQAASAQGQSNPNAATHSAQMEPTQAHAGVLTFRVTTREVILDVIALDPQGGPVHGLAPADLKVTYSAERDSARRQRHQQAAAAAIAPITGLHLADPNTPQLSAAGTRAGFQITASCLERSTLHYQLAFRPGSDGWTSGFHQVAVTTTRADVRLFYRHGYFVGMTIAPAKPPMTRPADIEKALTQDACYYPATPLSISLRARLVDTGQADVLRYQVAVDAASLAYVTLDANTGVHEPLSIDRRVQIDYGVCTFNAAGRPLGFFMASVDQVLASVDYARVLAHGFPHILEFQATPAIALTRFVVRDRATGNLGAVDVAFEGPAPGAAPVTTGTSSVPEESDSSAQTLLANETARDLYLFPVFRVDGYIAPPPGPIGSFGSVVPSVNSFCGDVYELEQYSSRLPDFRVLDPIGSLYAHTLDVPSQVFTNTEGIAGVTPRTNLFGIDYHARFWIRNRGNYEFRMISDDGAILRIDDQRVIDLDGLHSALGGSGGIHLEPGPHTMHIPYYQGAVTSVALLLWIKTPGGKDWQLFDLRNFVAPDAATP
jgi:hypothetical protein